MATETMAATATRATSRPRRFGGSGKMKALAAAIFPLLTACSTYAPDAGHEVVLIKKPWFLGHGGVVDTPVKTGRTFTAITTEGVDVYMQPHKYDTEMHDTMTSDGVPISFHAIMVLQVADSVALVKPCASGK